MDRYLVVEPTNRLELTKIINFLVNETGAKFTSEKYGNHELIDVKDDDDSDCLIITPVVDMETEESVVVQDIRVKMNAEEQSGRIDKRTIPITDNTLSPDNNIPNINTFNTNISPKIEEITDDQPTDHTDMVVGASENVKIETVDINDNTMIVDSEVPSYFSDTPVADKDSDMIRMNETTVSTKNVEIARVEEKENVGPAFPVIEEIAPTPQISEVTPAEKRVVVEKVAKKRGRPCAKKGRFELECQTCFKQFHSAKKFTQAQICDHAILHTDLIRYECTDEQCLYTASSTKSFTLHFQKVHPKFHGGERYRYLLTSRQEKELAAAVAKCFPGY